MRYLLFTQAERNFLKENEACRIATCHNGQPHIAPVSYLFEENDTAGFIFFATDYDSKKYKNLKRNRKIAFAIDVYNSSVDNKAVIIQVEVVEFIEGSDEFDRAVGDRLNLWINFAKSVYGLNLNTKWCFGNR
jgi:uncharacterized protein